MVRMYECTIESVPVVYVDVNVCNSCMWMSKVQWSLDNPTHFGGTHTDYKGCQIMEASIV